MGASPRVVIGWRAREWVHGRPVGRWLSERLLGGRQPQRSSKQHLLKTWATSHYSCSLTGRRPGRVGEEERKTREQGDRVDSERTLVLTFSWQLHSLSTTWGSWRRETELTLQKRRELRTFGLKRLRLYSGPIQGLRLLLLGLFAPLSSPLLVFTELLWGLWIRPSWIAGSSSERHGKWTKEPPLGIKPGLL